MAAWGRGCGWVLINQSGGGCVVVAVGCLQWLLFVFDELYIIF